MDTPSATVTDKTTGGTVTIADVANNSYHYKGNSAVVWSDTNGGTFVNETSSAANVTMTDKSNITVKTATGVTSKPVNVTVQDEASVTVSGSVGTINAGTDSTVIVSADSNVESVQGDETVKVEGPGAESLEVVANVKTAGGLVEALNNEAVTTINLASGNYEGQFTADRTVTINGAGQDKTTISAPSSVTEGNAVLLINNDANVTISNLTVDGKKVGVTALYGVKLMDASASLNKVTVKGITATPFGGAQEFRAVDARSENGNHSLHVTNSVVKDYQKSGIYVKGAGMTAVVDNNEITGVGVTTAIAQNGVTIMNGAKGTVTNNTISGHIYGTTDTAADILFYDADESSTATNNGNSIIKRGSATPGQ